MRPAVRTTERSRLPNLPTIRDLRQDRWSEVPRLDSLASRPSYVTTSDIIKTKICKNPQPRRRGVRGAKVGMRSCHISSQPAASQPTTVRQWVWSPINIPLAPYDFHWRAPTHVVVPDSRQRLRVDVSVSSGKPTPQRKMAGKKGGRGVGIFDIWSL